MWGMSSLSSVLAGRVMAADTNAPSRLLSCRTARKASMMLLLTPPPDSSLSSKLPCRQIAKSGCGAATAEASWERLMCRVLTACRQCGS